jgi:hypothetical protein
MARLITTTVYAKDSTVFASPSTMALNCDFFVNVQNASLKSKMSVPAASGSINTSIITNEPMNNSGERHDYLIAETLSAIVTASA